MRTMTKPYGAVSVALGGAALILAGALAPVVAKGPGDPASDVTLELLVWDRRGRQAEAVAEDLVRIAAERSGGSITIVPTYDLGPEAAPAIVKGDADLAILPTRDWGAQGVTSFDALEAPFLVDNDALALAIATSDIAPRMLAGLDAIGVTGLAMWPEDLRHLFAFAPAGRVLTTPDQFPGSTILSIAGQPGVDLIPALGGGLYQEGVAQGALTGSRDEDAASGALTGMVTGLWGAGLPPSVPSTVAGDQVLFAKYQTLVGNTDRLAALSKDQRALLDGIVAETLTAALGHHFTEAELAAERCLEGITIVEAGPEALAALKAAAQPLTNRLLADPVIGPLMTDIAALAATTERPPAPQSCDPAAGPAYPMSDATGFRADVLPAGSYRADVTKAELVGKGVDPEWATNNGGVTTITFEGDGYTFDHPAEAPCSGSVRPLATSLLLDGGDTCPTLNVLWRPEGDGVALLLAGPTKEVWPLIDFTNIQAHLEGRTWARLEGPLPSTAPVAARPELPAPGVWRIEQTVESLTARGMSVARAELLAGSVTLTFTGDQWAMQDGFCGGSYALEDGALVLQSEVNIASCGAAPTFLIWSAAGDGSATATLATTLDADAGEHIFVGQWTRIGDAPAPSIGPVAGGAFIGDQQVPPGTYRADMTFDGLLAAGATREFAGANEGVWEWTFTPDAWSAVHGRERCSGRIWIEDGAIHADEQVDRGCGMEYIFRWRPVADGIEVELVGVTGLELAGQDLVDNQAFLQRTWSRVADAPAPSASPAAFVRDRLPPAGSYRIQVTREELVARGATPRYAADNAGTWTLTFTDDGWQMVGVPGGRCGGSMALADESIRLRTVDFSGCTWDMDFEWRDAPEGIEQRFLAGLPSETPTDLANNRVLIDRIWTRVQ